MYLILSHSTPEDLKGVAELNPLRTAGPGIILILVVCGFGLGYGVWARTPRGKEYTARYIKENEKDLKHGKEVLENTALGCALLGPCLVPIVVIFIAAFVFAILFLSGLLSK